MPAEINQKTPPEIKLRKNPGVLAFRTVICLDDVSGIFRRNRTVWALFFLACSLRTVRFRSLTPAGPYKKNVVCLRLTDWNTKHDEIVVAQEKGASVFTIPGEEQKFLKHIRESFALIRHRLHNYFGNDLSRYELISSQSSTEVSRQEVL